MATKVEQSIQVRVPVRTAYDQWTQFEEFPRFMGGVQEIRQTGDDMTHWVVEIGGVKREFDARILEQVPDTKVAWAATTGATNAGAVYFTPVGPEETTVRLEMEYEPEGVVEKVGDALNVVERRAKADLEKFKEFIESRGSQTGGWRGEVDQGGGVGTPGVEAASASMGDSGGAGVSPLAAVAGAAVATAGVAAVAGAVKNRSGDSGGSGATASTSEYETLPPSATGTGATGTGATGTGTTGASAGSAEAVSQAEPLEPLPVDPLVEQVDVTAPVSPATAHPGQDPRTP
jgi:carbon monoxide dehydrogenase subunit G